MLQLRIQPAHGEPFARSLSDQELVIGRSSECDLTINDRYMSRRHARLFMDGDAWWIEDLGSRNGTVVNGRPVTERSVVALGDEIVLSGSSLRLEDSENTLIAPAKPDVATGEHNIFREASQVLQSHASMPPESMASVPALQDYASRLQLLNEIHKALAASETLEDLLEALMARAFELLRPEDGVVVIKQADGSYLQAVRHFLPGNEEEHPLSATLIHEVAERKQSALVLDLAEDERFAAAESMMASGMRSLIAAPLTDEDGPLGLIALSSRLHKHQFSEADMELLTSLASVAALRMRNLALADEAAERRRLEQEVQLARKIQVGLLPDRLPDLETYELHGGTVPSQGVSGDFYEILERSESECVLVIADVSGKGISASLLTASLEALLAGALDAGLSPHAACDRVSRSLFERTPAAKYATAILAVLEPSTGSLTFTNAGHNPALVVSPGGAVRELTASGPPIGLLPEPTFSEQVVTLEPGDLLVLYTDGITEAADPEDEEFGLERLTELCVARRDGPLDALATDLNEALERFARGVAFADDRTLVLLRRHADS